MNSNSDIHDDLLFSMLQECRTLPIFLNHVFGFLHRRTDFYKVAPEKTAPVGLPPGLAEQIVKQTFYKWKTTHDMPSAHESKPKKPEPEPSSSHQSATSTVNVTKPKQCQFLPSDYYNGQCFPNYCWSQTIGEIDVVIAVPPGTVARDLDVGIEPKNRFKITLKSGNTTLLEDELRRPCKTGIYWSLTAQNRLEIHLEKCDEIWWDCLLANEEKRIDTTTLDCSRPYEELSEEAQAKIDELQWNQQRKQMGLPTSDELRMRQVLKKAWDEEGSPFSGPFDPDSVQLS